jgi:hypothetical protein
VAFATMTEHMTATMTELMAAIATMTEVEAFATMTKHDDRIDGGHGDGAAGSHYGRRYKLRTNTYLKLRKLNVSDCMLLLQ